MKCPNDQTEMVKGSLYSHGWGWSQNYVGSRIPKLLFRLMPGKDGAFVNAYRCPKCGKIELYTEK